MIFVLKGEEVKLISRLQRRIDAVNKQFDLEVIIKYIGTPCSTVCTMVILYNTVHNLFTYSSVHRLYTHISGQNIGCT